MANDNVSVVPDPFSDDLFAPLDTRGAGGSLTDELQKIADEDVAAAPASEVPVVETPPAPPTAEEPKVYEFEDGSTAEVSKGSRGWKAVLDSKTGGGTETFYGATKDELLLNVMAGKINATQKIREMNRTIKLGTVTPEPTVETAVSPTPEDRVLSADEITELRTTLASNPDLAFSSWFQKRTGMTVSELVKLAKLGKEASDDLNAEAVVKGFLNRHEDYIPYDKNFEAMIAWLCKNKLRQSLGDRAPGSMIDILYRKGLWTDKNLDEAYDDLVADGLLDLQPEEAPAGEVEAPPEPEPTPEKPVVVEIPKPTPSNERIVREVRRPRAGLGIRAKETVAVSPDEASRPPSDEELDNLSDDEVGALFAGVRKLHLGTRR